jgi:hypothetical protein
MAITAAMRAALEKIKDAVRKKAASHGHNVTVCGEIPAGVGEMRERVSGRCGTDARQYLQHAKCSDRVPRVLDPTQHTDHVLDVRRLKEFKAAVFHERNVPARKFDLKLVAMVAGTEQHRLSLQVNARFAVFQNALDDILDLC